MAAGLLLAACGGSTTETATDATPAAVEREQATSTEASTPAAAAPATLDEFLGGAANLVRGGGGGQGGGGAGGGFDATEQIEQQRLVQQEIQVCMQAQGFAYVPEEVGDGLRFFAASQQASLSAAEYAETEGFGISTRFDAVLEGDIDLSESTSPNDEHLATLSEGEADAWQFALRGAPPERNDQGQLIDPETGEALRPGQAVGGCNSSAQEAVRGDVSAFFDLAASYDELETRIEADPRVAEISQQWSACMSAEGFDYTDEAEARAEINAEFRPLLRSLFQGNQNGQGGGQQGGGNRLAQIAGLELSAEQEAELEALQDQERAIAVAAHACEADTVDEIAEITARYEEEFIDANRAVLEGLSG
jgi:hypothetical protein